MKREKKKISIVVPCFNEHESLPLLWAELRKTIDNERISPVVPHDAQNPLAVENYDWELLLVNDGSSDDTLKTMEALRKIDPRVCYVNLSRNFGKEKAMLAGLDFATGDCVVIMDADLQHPPEVIPRMVEQWESGFDDVYARRARRGDESWVRKRLSLAFYSILRRTTRNDVLPNVGDFRLLDRRCVDALRRMRECERYTKGLAAWIGYNKKEIVFDQRDRAAGRSSWHFSSLLNLAVEAITGFTTAPLRIATVAGVGISIAAFVLMFYFLIKTLVLGDAVRGFPTLIVVVLFLGGAQLFSIGVIGEYLGRVFNETKNRPTYIAESYNGKKL